MRVLIYSELAYIPDKLFAKKNWSIYKILIKIGTKLSKSNVLL